MLTKRTTILLSVLLCGVFLSSSCTVSSPASGSSAVTETGTLSRVTTAAVAAGTRAPRWHMDEAKTRAVPTLDELTRISTRIFRGTYLYSEAIPGVSGSLQDVFQVQSIEKDLIPIEGKTVAAMRKSSSPVSLAVDRCYLVFTDFADASVYPTPSFHTLALFPLESDGSMNSAYTSGQMLDLFPFLIETRLTKDIVSATRHSSVYRLV